MPNDNFQTLSARIAEFSHDEPRAHFYVGMLKVGLEQGHSIDYAMTRVMAAILLDFNRIPTNPEQN